MSTNPLRRASDRPNERRWMIGRRVVLGLLILAGIVVAGRVFWRVGSGEETHDGGPNWSPNSQRLVFSREVVSGTSSQLDLFSMNVDGTDRRQLTSTPSIDADPAFSPDGTQIAFDSDRDGNLEIYVMNADGTNVRRVTNDPAADRAPAWSPDGRRLAFTSERGRKGQADVYITTVDGAEIQRLTNSGVNFTPQFSKDGRLVIQADTHLEVITLNTGERRQLGSETEDAMSPSWSPDSKQIAFISQRNNGRLELFAMNDDGSNSRVLASMSDASLIDPRWSPDGSRIAFVHVPRQSAEDSKRNQPYAIYVLEIASGKISRLSP